MSHDAINLLIAAHFEHISHMRRETHCCTAPSCYILPQPSIGTKRIGKLAKIRHNALIAMYFFYFLGLLSTSPYRQFSKIFTNYETRSEFSHFCIALNSASLSCAFRVKMLRTLAMVAAATIIASTAAASDGHKVLSGNSLRKAISGRTIHLHTPIGSTIPIRYRANGTMTGRSSISLAALAGEKVNKDRGRWWVRNSQLCQKWRNWSNGRSYCYTLKVSGSSVYWTRSDGRSGTARLSN